jgi:hypothetical protein
MGFLFSGEPLNMLSSLIMTEHKQLTGHKNMGNIIRGNELDTLSVMVEFMLHTDVSLSITPCTPTAV